MGTGGSSLSSLTGASLDADPLFSEKDPEVLLSNLLINLILSFLHFDEDVGESVGKLTLFTNSFLTS